MNAIAVVAVRAALAGQAARGAVWLKLALFLPLFLGAAALSIGKGSPPPTPGESAEQETPRTTVQAPVRPGKDLAGDPLPPGALARLGTVRWRHSHRTADLATAFSPDGKIVVTVGDGTLKRWDTATGKLLGQFSGRNLGAVQYAPNGRWLVGQSGDLLDPASGEVARRLVPGGRPLAFTPDSALLATAAADHTVTLWNTATGAVTHQ